MKKIYKYEIGANGTSMPDGATIVNFNMQKAVGGGSHFVTWALVDPSAPMVKRNLRVRATGESVANTDKYYGTCFDDPFVWHLFETEESGI